MDIPLWQGRIGHPVSEPWPEGSTVARSTSSVDPSAFWRDGFVGPFQALDAERMAHIREGFFKQFSRRDGGAMNRHFDMPAIFDLCIQANFLKHMQAILQASGLVLWRTNIFSGNPKLRWHEDHHGNLIEGPDISLSCLVAITNGDAENCTLLVPGSQKLSVQEKEARFGIQAERMPGGNIRYEGHIPPAEFVRAPLASGQCIIFHPALLHASSGFVDRAAGPDRVSVVFRVTSTRVKILPRAYAGGPKDAARPVLVRGCAAAGAGGVETPPWPGTAP